MCICWDFVHQLIFIRWSLYSSTDNFIHWCFTHQLVFLTVSGAFLCINQVDNYNVSPSCITILCLRIFTIWHSTCTYPCQNSSRTSSYLSPWTYPNLSGATNFLQRSPRVNKVLSEKLLLKPLDLSKLKWGDTNLLQKPHRVNKVLSENPLLKSLDLSKLKWEVINFLQRPHRVNKVL